MQALGAPAAQPNMSRLAKLDRMKVVYLLRLAAASEREAAAAARAEATARQVAEAEVRAVKAEAKLESRSAELLRVKGRPSMRGVFDFVEEEMKGRRVEYQGLTCLNLRRKIIAKIPSCAPALCS